MTELDQTAQEIAKNQAALDNKLARVDLVLKRINSDYEKNGGLANAKLGDQKKIACRASEMTRLFIKIGLPIYDRLCGGEVLGLPVIDYGLKGSGKSTFNYWKIGKLQAMGKLCVVVNVEGGFDPQWAATCGVDLSRLILIDQGDVLEETVQIVWDIIKENVVDHILLDSIHGQMTKKEMYKAGKGANLTERKIADETVGSLPQKIGSFLRRINPVLGKSKCSLTIIGQARTDIEAYGAPIALTGGHALKHFARRIVRWDIAPRSEWPMMDGEPIGRTSRLTIESQQLNEHQGEFFFLPLRKGKGLYEEKIFADDAIRMKVILPGRGSYWQFEGADGKTVSVNGLAALYKHLENVPKDLELIKKKLMELSTTTIPPPLETSHDTDGGEEQNSSQDGSSEDIGTSAD